MGMYTKYYGTINISSLVTYKDRLELYKKRLEEFKKQFENKYTNYEFRSYIVDDLALITGINGCINIVFTGEIKNYNNEVDILYQELAKEFPQGEGIMYSQYEEAEYPTIYVLTHGSLVPCQVYIEMKGHGNSCGVEKGE